MATAGEFLQFVNKSPSPFHAVAEVKRLLLAKGFAELKEKAPWKLAPKGRYFFTRNQSSLVAFAVGSDFTCGNGFNILAAHTDSPCLKLKPVSKKESSGYLQVAVQTYGGGLWHTWFDRDLSIAGRVIVKTAGGGLSGQLVCVNRPILRIPTLAIHLDRTVNEKLQFNNETHLTPILATAVKNALNGSSTGNSSHSHHPALLNLLAKELSVSVEQIEDFELCLFDTQESRIGGLFNEFIFSSRLDNLLMSFCSVKSLLDTSSNSDELIGEKNIRMAALFDNEEVGSESAYGAGSNLLESAMKRIAFSFGSTASQYEEGLQKSFLISADMAHALHPNYSEKHESNHQPKIHAGLVIKINANQRYATTSVSSALIKRLASCEIDGNKSDAPVAVQEFVVRNDTPCGSTIGPILSAKLGIRTVDVGAPQLSMHSIREMCGVDDIDSSIKIFSRFFKDFSTLDQAVIID